MMRILGEEAELQEIVSLVGVDALSKDDRLTLETAKIVREDYLHQNAFHEVDTYTSLFKQYRMLELIAQFYEKGKQALAAGANIEEIIAIPARERIGRAKYVEEKQVHAVFGEIEQQISSQLAELEEKGGEDA